MNDFWLFLGLGVFALGLGGCFYLGSKGNAEEIIARAEAKLIESQIDISTTEE